MFTLKYTSKSIFSIIYLQKKRARQEYSNNYSDVFSVTIIRTNTDIEKI